MGVRDMIGAGRQWVPAQLVSADTLVGDPKGRFSFKIPWPWFHWEGDFDLHVPQHDDRVVLFAPRTTDPWPEASIWSTDETFDVDDHYLKSESRRLAAFLGGRSRRARRLVVGGVPAAAFFVESIDMVTHQVAIASPAGTVFAVFRLPAGNAAGYEVHIETMLATWEWA